MMLPSWQPGAARDAVVAFLESAEDVPIDDRMAVLDNDGTLWCERPTYVPWDFFVDALRRRVAEDSALREREEYRAVLAQDAAAVGEIGLAAIVIPLAELFTGQDPREYVAAAREFAGRWTHPTLGRGIDRIVYQPMLELIAELRRREFTVGVVTGGGTEFVRAISQSLYGVPPELVVGTLIEHEVVPGPAIETESGTDLGLRRTASLLGHANEGPAKVVNIQNFLGRRPLLAAGNSGGDTDMLAWAAAGGGLALVVDHDDPDREFAYESRAESFAQAEPLLTTARRQGWTAISMRDDWSSVFPPELPG